ncbi:aspartic peptidase domain-containing protein [Halenospora varia]|nr:aspartic peptidase domain-containing protein [Halenospora varia]
MVVSNNTTIPAPLVISPSQYWEGNDGPWSTFTLQLGTPAQNVRVMISTAGSATWVVLPEGCVAGMPSNCPDLRGKQFNRNASTTWKFNNYYELQMESNLGYTGSGEFGFDKIGLDWQGAGGPVLDRQVIAGVATEQFWFGLFGLTARPTNFTDFNDPQLSFVETLRNKRLIPSLSWSYTAGAQYRLSKVFGSLVLGGYDSSKAGLTNMSFSFGADISRDLTVGLQSISAVVGGQKTELLSTSIFTFIDSSVPQIWLPLAACTAFENLLGLTWNATIGYYLVSDTLHEKLISTNPSLTFKLGKTAVGGTTIDITLPYASFDLWLDYPIVSNKTRYFPLAPAANDTQYTLGRTFLQEAYLTVDYERSNFSLSQVRFEAGASQHIVAIPSINATTNSTSTSTDSSAGKSLTTGALASIIAGSIVVVIATIVGIYFFFKRRRTEKKAELPDNQIDNDDPYQKAELDAQGTHQTGHEMDGGTNAAKFELQSPIPEPVYEMDGVGSVRELASPDVAAHEMENSVK